jgi:DNA-binding CsgD family transcriptional regulator
MLAVMRGELKSARKSLLESDSMARRLGVAPAELVARAGLAMCDELAGDHAGAARRYHDLRLFWEGTEDRLDILIGLCRAATFFANQRDREELAACAEAARRIASGDAHSEALGSLAFILGEVALLDDEPGEAAAHFQRARDQFERCDLRPDMMRCDWRLGEALRRAGETGAAAEALRRSYREARSLGVRPLMDALAETLANLGKPPTEERTPDAPARTARAGLTQRQKEVAALIADGMTNKEIASELGLSTRTVDMHVGNVLDRLNCRSRSEAVRKLLERGVLE